MNPMLDEEEMEMPAEGGDELAALDAETLKELMSFSKRGMAKDIGSRLAPPPPVEEAPAEDPEIPGVEAVPAEGGEPDVEKLKALLASLGG